MFTAEQLLIPISDSKPCGDNMAFSSELDAIAHARKFDDPSLAQGAWETELKEADWDFVVDRCAKLLKEKSKDLRLAVWLTEAAAKQHHLRGLGEGYRLLAGLCDQFWDLGLYPDADDGDNDQAQISQTSLGTEFSVGDIHGLLSGNGANATVTHLWAGTDCAFR